MKARAIFALIFLTLTSATAGRAESESEPQIVPFDSDRWTIEARQHELTEHLGRPSLFLKAGQAVLADEEITDGVIEFDVAFSGARGFMGCFWRMRDSGNKEDFYIRPHQSGNPDANQYTPVFNGVSGWQLYHGEGHSAIVEYPTDTWVHVKIVFSGSRGEVYIDSEEPVLAIHEMKREVGPGKVGVTASNFAPAHFSRFSYRKLDSPALNSPEPPKPTTTPAGTIKAWSVSSGFAEATLTGKTLLGDADKQNLTWQALAAESGGLTNLARVAVFDPTESNTVFARVVVHAQSEVVKRLRFGYSDRVKIYLNDWLLYAGDNTYRTRDYRYLGTIGLFDALYLSLREGRNELWLAVSESFGGWGVQATFDDPSGIRLEPEMSPGED